jgi:hypothetical protein
MTYTFIAAECSVLPVAVSSPSLEDWGRVLLPNDSVVHVDEMASAEAHH